MIEAHGLPPAFPSEFIAAIELTALTDSEAVNYTVYDCVIKNLVHIVEQNPHDWSDTCKRRVALEYVRAIVLGRSGHFIYDRGLAHYRETAEQTGSVFTSHTRIPWLSENERARIDQLIARAHADAINS